VGPPIVIKDLTHRSLRTQSSVRGRETSLKEPKTSLTILYVLGPSKPRGLGAAGSDLTSSRPLFNFFFEGCNSIRTNRERVDFGIDVFF